MEESRNPRARGIALTLLGGTLWGVCGSCGQFLFQYAVTLVIYTLQPADLMKRYSTLLTLGWGMAVGGVILMLIKRPWSMHPIVDGQTVLAMCFIVIFGTICAFYFYLSGVRLVGASSASMLACIEPVAATVISVLWLKVRFQVIDLAGFVLVISTVFIISLNQMKEEKRNEFKREAACR